MNQDPGIPTIPLRAALIENRRKAALLFIMAVALLATMDMIVKFASSSLSTPQIVWGRYVAQSLAMVLIVGPAGMLTCIRSKVPRMHVARALLLFVANFAFMAALRYLPLIEANVVGFVSPLLLTALTYPVLGEKVSVSRWAAVIAGFIGVLIVMQPGTAMFQWAAMLPLTMAMCAALYHVMTPIVARVEDPAISIVFLGIIGAASMSLVVPWFWTEPDALGWAMLFVIGVLGTIGHLLIVRAFAHVSASMLAPFFYIHLIWATAYGWFIFGDFPKLATIIGGMLIIASGIYVYRSGENKRPQQTRTDL
jgi:drug/metabolite transporter (DMT)-like permease